MKAWKTGQEILTWQIKQSCHQAFGESGETTDALLKELSLQKMHTQQAVNYALGVSMGGGRACGILPAWSAGALGRIADLGCHGGLVFLLMEEPDLPIDAVSLARQWNLPLLEPSSPKECGDFLMQGLAASQEIKTPVLVYLRQEVLSSGCMAELTEQAPIPCLEYQRESGRFARLPGREKQLAQMNERQEKMQSWVKESSLNRILGDGSQAVIAVGSKVYGCLEGPEKRILHLGVCWPLDVNAIQEFCGQDEAVLLADSQSLREYMVCQGIRLKEIPQPSGEEASPEDAFQRQPQLCPGCPWRGVFYTLKKERAAVFAQEGCAVLGAGLLMKGLDGAGPDAIALATGFCQVRKEKRGKTAVLLTAEDFSRLTLQELRDFHESGCFAVVLDDKSREYPWQEWAALGEVPVFLEAQAHDLAGIREGIRGCMGKSGGILRLLGECAHTAEEKVAYHVNREVCSGCRQCLRMGCPAISFPGHKSEIAQDLCAGCGLCGSICPVKAIERGESL